jgi:hypothetical protein
MSQFRIIAVFSLACSGNATNALAVVISPAMKKACSISSACLHACAVSSPKKSRDSIAPSMTQLTAQDCPNVLCDLFTKTSVQKRMISVHAPLFFKEKLHGNIYHQH